MIARGVTFFQPKSQIKVLLLPMWKFYFLRATGGSALKQSML